MDLGDELGDGEVSTPKVKEVRGKEKSSLNQNVIITQAGLNLVKSIYKQIELLNVLNYFSFEIVLGMFKTFWFYIFTVFYLFGNVEM